jgi:LysM repeat protein
MALTDKYQPLIQMAEQAGVSNLSVQEQEGVLRVTGIAPSEEVKQRLWDEYNRIDPDMRSGDLVMDLEVAQGAAAGGGQTYTVRKGDTLSEIGSRHGVSWREIFEANRDQIDDPNKIFPGQTLRIPGK